MTTMGCFVHVVNDDGELLVVRQGYGKRLWTTPGGRVEPGESPVQAAVRETLEETGLTIVVIGLLGVYSKPYCDDVVIGVYGRIVDRAREWEPNDEIAALRWFGAHQLPTEMAFNTRTRILDAFAGKSGVLRIFDTPDTLSIALTA